MYEPVRNGMSKQDNIGNTQEKQNRYEQVGKGMTNIGNGRTIFANMYEQVGNGKTHQTNIRNM